MDKIETEIESLKNLGRRISVLTNVKVLLSEYIMNDTYQLNSSLPTIKTMNNKIIDESYNIERTLLSINIGDEAGTLDKYNSGNLCNFIPEYQNNGIFATQFDKN